MSSSPLNRSVFGWWPMATNSPVTGSTDDSPVTTSDTTRALRLASPSRSVTTVFHRNSIFGFANARSCMIFEARSVSRRWIRVTLSANLLRKMASSTRRVAAADDGDVVTAEEEPVARRAGRDAVADQPPLGLEAEHQRAGARATMTASASCSVSRDPDLERSVERSTLVTFSVMNSAPNRCGLFAEPLHQLGTHDALGEPGVVLDVGRQHQLAAGLVAGARGSPSMTRGARLARAA